MPSVRFAFGRSYVRWFDSIPLRHALADAHRFAFYLKAGAGHMVRSRKGIKMGTDSEISFCLYQLWG